MIQGKGKISSWQLKPDRNFIFIFISSRDVRGTEGDTLDLTKCIKIFIPINSLVSIRKLKRKFRRFGKVEAVNQDPTSYIRQVLYIQPNPETDGGIWDDPYWLSASE